jgi:SAM-dependent methyltransferase
MPDEAGERFFGEFVVKTAIKKALWACGYDIHKRQPQALDDSILTDEGVSGPWVGRALQVSNRYYRPPVLQHHHSQYGDDTRLKYITDFLDVRDQRILEIGPLEGYHSTILEKMGVRENIAIESRAINLRKCQRTKDKYHLDHTHFLQADLERLYKEEEVASFKGPFDLVFCAGVLYHLPDPGRGLEWMRSQSSALFLATHYCAGRPRRNDVEYHYCGKSYRARRMPEGGIDDPLSGMSPSSMWLYESDLLNLIRDVGYSRTSVLGRDLQNNHYHITLIAEA